MKKLHVLLVSAALTAACLLTASADIVFLSVENDVVGNGTTLINITGKDNGNNGAAEVATPIYSHWNNGTGAGDTWGGTGLNIGSHLGVNFTTTSIRNSTNGTESATGYFNGDGNGMGLVTDGGSNPWEVGGDEGWTWTADAGLVFEGLTFRGGNWGGVDTKELTISSPAWVGLSGITPGAGVTYLSGPGSFVLENSAGNAGGDGTFTGEELTGGSGLLSFDAGTGISFSNTKDGGDAYGFSAFAFNSAVIPEPGVFSLLSLGILLLALTRRRAKN